MLLNRRNRLIVVMSFFLMAFSAYSYGINDNRMAKDKSQVCAGDTNHVVDYDTVCQPAGDANNDAIHYWFSGVDFQLPLHSRTDEHSSWQYLIEYHDMDLCRTEQMHLTIHPSYEVHDTVVACNSYTWQKHLKTIRVSDDIALRMIFVEGGSFMMGATPEQGAEAEEDEKPVHEVTLSNYYMGETEITQELWEEVMGTTIYEQVQKFGDNGSPIAGAGPKYPMYKINVAECKQFIEALNTMTGLQFRMPTEAEWEYAARGGKYSQGYKYPGSNDVDAVAWYKGNSNHETHPVALKKPNELGLYDMAGNVWEWVSDWYADSYPSTSQVNPTGPTTGSLAIMRGGSRANTFNATDCRVSARLPYAPTTRNFIGLRLVLDDDGESSKTLTTSGIYYDTLQTIHGCDSIRVLHLTIDTTKYGEETIVACDSYTWNGTTYTVSGDYTYNTTAKNGCDSIATLHLVIHPSYEYHDTIVACDSYTWNGKSKNIVLSDNLAFKMIFVEGGSFMMGAADDDVEAEDIEKPAHQVTLSSYYMSETEITQKVWEVVMGTTLQDELDAGGGTYLGSGDNYPMYAISWYDSQMFAQKLSQLTGLNFRLPTEAEWEYAARGGKYSQGYKYAGSNNLDEVAWYNARENTSGDVHPVASLKPNELGLYDMTGNVWEWCQDAENTYTAEPQVNPVVPRTGSQKAIERGGSTYGWGLSTYRVSCRFAYDPAGKKTRQGIRLVLEDDGSSTRTFTQSGIYYDTLQTIHGCDSIRVLHLTIDTTKYGEETIVACDSYTWNGTTYTVSGDYTYTTTAANGCDSIITLHLTIHNSQVGTTESATICYGETYSWNGNTYTTLGSYTDTLQNIYGCDSIVTLHLHVNPTYEIHDTIVACDSYLYNPFSRGV